MFNYRKRLVVIAMLLALPFGAQGADAKAYVQNAEKAYEQGEYRTAVIHLKNALREDSDHAGARLMLGKIHLELGDPASAAKELRRARQLGIERSQWVLPYASALIAQGEMERVINDIEIDPEDEPELRANLHVLKGQAYLAEGMAVDAEDSFETARGLDEDNADALVGLAQLALNDGDLDRAETAIDQALAVDAESYAANLIKAEVVQRRGRAGDALGWYEKALNQNPDDLRARLGKVDSLISSGQFDKAEAYLDTFDEKLAEHPLVQYVQGLVYFNKNELDKAESLLSASLSALPGNVMAKLFLGSIKYQNNEYEQAEVYLKSYLDSSPRHLPARQMLGALYLNQKKPARAIEILKPLEEQARDNAGYIALLGAAYLQSGDVERGMRLLEQSRSLSPELLPIQAQIAYGQLMSGDTEAGINTLRNLSDSAEKLEYDIMLVLSYLGFQDKTNALALVEKMRSKYPDNAVVANLEGIVQLAREDTEAARQAFRKATELEPGLVPAHINLANIEFRDGDVEAARRILSTAAERVGENSQLYMSRARLAEAEGRQAQAEQYYRRAYELEEADTQAGLSLAGYYIRTEQNEKALTVLTELKRRHPGDPGVLSSLGMVQMNMGNTGSAGVNFKALVRESPRSARAHYLLARYHLAQDDPDAAEQALQEALALSPGDLELRTTEVRIAAAQEDYARVEELIAAMEEDFSGQGIARELEGDLLRRREKYAEAADAYASAFAVRDENRALFTKLYRTHLELGNRDKVLSLMQEWLSAHPRDVQILSGYAVLLNESGDTDDAREQYLKLLDLDPDNLLALNNVAFLQLDTDPEAALRHARRAYELAPQRPEIMDTYGWALLQNDRLTDGMRILWEASSKAPHIAEIRYHLAVGYMKQGEPEKAKIELDAIRGKFDELSDPEAARELYERLS